MICLWLEPTVGIDGKEELSKNVTNNSSDRINDYHSSDLNYSGGFNSSLFYGLPPVIPRLYSTPGAPIPTTNTSAEEAAAMARLSAGLGALPSWSPFLNPHPQGSGPHCTPNAFGCGSSPFPPSSVSFPFFAASPLGFHPLDFSSMRVPMAGSLPMGDLDLKGLDPRAVLSAYIGDLANSRHLTPEPPVPLTSPNNSESSPVRPVCEPSSGASAGRPVSELSDNRDVLAALNQAGQRFKAMSGAQALGHRFFPYNVRPFLINAQQSAQQNRRSTSPIEKSALERKSGQNGQNGQSVSPNHSPLSNNCSNESHVSSGKNSSEDPSHRISNSGSPIPELKNIQRMVEGLDTRGTPLFVPTTVAS